MAASSRKMEVEKLVPAVHCEVIQAVESYGTVNVFVICLDQLGHDQNIIDLGFALQLACAVNHAKKQAVDQDIHLVVICSAKRGSFMAGADILTELQFTGDSGSQRAFEDSLKFSQVLCALESLSVPTVAILNGTTLGGGLELSLACDYRIADETCTQIGLPEVKIGVLPGAGGCVRLPRLIGMKRALEILLTGNPVKAYKAHCIGLVDLIMPDTHTLVNSTGDQKSSYDYKWLVSLLSFIERKAIGKREFLVGSTRTDLVALDVINVYEEVRTRDVEKELIAKYGDLWRDYEYKASVKFTTLNRIDRASVELLNTGLYLLSLVQLWWNTGSQYPAPYICLLTTFKCASATSWKEAITLNSLGFAVLATSAESKSLMALFLLTRKLKRLAIHFELKGDENPPKVKKDVMVLISNQGLHYSSTFVQGLLFAGFEVRVVDVSESLTKSKMEEFVRKHFEYSLKRGHLSVEDVEKKLSHLSFNHGRDVSTMEFDAEGPMSVVDCSMGDGGGEGVLTHLRKQVREVVCMSTAPGSVSDDRAVLINLGDPRRKNTLCVEITPATKEVSATHVRHVASLIVAAGKLPTLTPPTPHSQASHLLTLSHWALAVTMAARCRLSKKKFDSILCDRGGYSKGPFDTMTKLDADYVQLLVNGNHSTVPHFDQLKSYITTRKLPSVRYRSSPFPSQADLVELFNLFLGLVALQVRQSTPDISEAAIDVLAVSGLVSYPPSEGGPLNRLARCGLSDAKKRWSELSKFLPSETKESYGELLEGEAFDTLFVKSKSSESELTEYERMKEETLLLTSSELKAVGRTGMVGRRDVFMYPLPTVLAIGIISFLTWSAFCVFLYYLL